MGTVRPKLKQGNTTNLNISFSNGKRKKSCSGGIRTYDILLTRQMLYPLSYRGSSAGWAESRQYKACTVYIALGRGGEKEDRERGGRGGEREDRERGGRAESN